MWIFGVASGFGSNNEKKKTELCLLGIVFFFHLTKRVFAKKKNS
jgi:hypothetical protein